MSQNQKLGIINLIPKKEKDLRHLKNWRPVTLLNTDYKILAKALANRLHKIIGNLISTDQVGYIKKRYIGENIRLMFDLMSYTNENDIDAILAQIDFEKAFDSIEWSFLYKTLKTFNFGEYFISWVKLLYSDIKSCVGNNGYFSKFFVLSRSIRQGCPISALLFILVAEIIAIKIRSNTEIKGILISDIELKISLMADDTTLCLSDIESLRNAICEFQKFTICSGLKLNIEKTEIIPLGNLINKLDTIILPESLAGIQINTGPFKALGVWFSKNDEEIIDLNFKERLNSMQKLINIWNSRSLSLRGKIMIIRALILPQIQFLFSMIETPEHILKKIDEMLFKYLWNNKPSKIKRQTIIAPTEEGGLNMVDVYEVNNAAKYSWIKRLVSDIDGKWKPLMWDRLDISRELINRNVNVKSLKPKSNFHKQVLNAWNQIHIHQPDRVMEILNQYITHNQFIQINNNYIDIKEESLSNIKIGQIININKNIMNNLEIDVNFGIKIDPWRWMAIVSAIPREWKKKIKQENCLVNMVSAIKDNETYIVINNKYKLINLTSSKEIYQKLIKNKTQEPTALKTWLNIFPFMETVDWNKIFSLTFKIIREPYFHSFQYKILNRILNCKDKLFTWKLSENNECIYCNEIDTIEHHLFTCVYCRVFWNLVSEWIKDNLDTSFNFTICEIIFGIPISYNPTINAINFIIILGKWYINNVRTLNKTISFPPFLKLIKRKINEIILIKTTNNIDPKLWEIDLLIAL